MSLEQPLPTNKMTDSPLTNARPEKGRGWAPRSWLRAHWPILLILAIFSLLSLYNAAILPLGEAADETDHYQYLRFVARTGHPPLTAAQREEAGFKGGLAPLYYWLTAWPIALVGVDSRPEVRRVDARPERRIPTDGLGINHVMHTPDEGWPWRGQILAWQLIRFLSLPMAWVTIIATYLLAGRLWPVSRPVAVGAAAFVAFLPRFVISSAVINDDNMVFALIALLLLVQVIILQGNRRVFTFALLGALFGLALITKYFSLILIPELLFTLFASYRAGADGQTQASSSSFAARAKSYRPWLAFLAALLLTAGPWFTFIILRFNRIEELGLIPGLAASLGEPQITEGLVGLLSGRSIRPPAATYSFLAWLGLLYRSFWFEYGWMQIFAPGWIYGLFTLFLGLALVGLITGCLRRSPFTRDPNRQATTSAPNQAILWLLGIHLALFIVVVLARYVLSATIDTGQGRHLYPALPVIALLAALGLYHLRSLTWLRRLPAICFLLPALISLQPSAFILPHYQIIPVTISPPGELPITYRQSLPFAEGLSLAGLKPAGQTSAGEALPVTLFWQAEQEAERDYLLSLCLQDQAGRPVACWRGHFVDGRYPARAWEAGDTLIDTVFIPIPTCYRLLDETYNLHLEIWPVKPDSPDSTPEERPVLDHTFAEPALTLKATDSLLKNYPQTIDLWQAGTRLPETAAPGLRQTVTQISYAGPGDRPAAIFHSVETDQSWLPVETLETPLYLPCDEGPSPFAHLSPFIVDPTLPSGSYRPTGEPPSASPHLSLSLRSRRLAPIQSNLSFAGRLSPLSLQLPARPPLNLSSFPTPHSPFPTPHSPFPTPHSPSPYLLLPARSASLPITIRWQARQWMADPLVVSLKLLDKDFMIGGERVATLGDRYPNVLWVPTEIVEETYPLRIEPDAPPGLYRLELSLVHPGDHLPEGFEYLPLTDGQAGFGYNLYPVTVRLLDPAHGSAPAYPLSAHLGDAIRLNGYDLDQAPTAPQDSPSESTPPGLRPAISLALYWQSSAPIPVDYTVFTQLIGPDGQVWAQWDNPPQAGRYPTTAWLENDTVVDRYRLTLREGAPPGDYRLLVGMYDPTTGRRLPVTINGQPQPDQAVELATLSIPPPDP